MKNQKYFAKTLLGLAILALGGTMASGQDGISKNTPTLDGKAKSAHFFGLTTTNNSPNKDSEEQRPPNLLGEAFRYNLCNLTNPGCNGYQPQAGMIKDNGTVNPGNFYGTTTWPLIGGQVCPTPGFSGLVREIENQSNYSGGNIYMMDPQTQQYTTLFMLWNTSDAYGWNPVGGLVQDANGNLWGTSCTGGNNSGAIFELQPRPYAGDPWPWSVSQYYDFTYGTYPNPNDGAAPTAGLYLDPTVNSNCPYGCMYGTTSAGGNNDGGTLFRIALPQVNEGAWTETPIYSFGNSSTDAKGPYASVIKDANSDVLYGTTQYGGANGAGTIWMYDVNAATESILYNFCSQSSCTDGQNPVASLSQDSSGNLWGTTLFGGANGLGEVFMLAPPYTSAPTTVYSFAGGTDGAYPAAALVPDSNTAGSFLGTTAGGGNTGCTSSFPGSGCGTVFQVGPSSYNQFYLFLSSFDGTTPLGSVVQDGYGDIWGTTQLGGASAGGTIYELGCPGLCAVIQPNPSNLQWEKELVGHIGAAQYVKVTNIGTEEVKFASVRITGDFQLVKTKEGTCVGALAPGASCIVGATFNPRTKGLLVGQITLTDSAQNSPQVVALSGIGE